ncbi:uroporphyrinogen-III synthase [Aestuariicoccus sp. MJ-SS9]|uniref:uroporphyrinogen-III synthase n=1 Tax=Aestuariicoccus sp. MJ-SS9 TaxID=3079855 RepID=UPI002914D25D|nr:uroporphyrinogen-III synthase [Aestuariicoccus sp. MJ-SS9]MDU8910020.1 uroporphyrinogen-III synthase [Aestuariicoccus sp. MJ-SS9]
MARPDPILLMTRPQAASETFVQALRDAGVTGFRAVVSPLMAARTNGRLPDMDGFGGLIFTSANGVHSYGVLGGRTDLPAFCVGQATARVAEEIGLTAVSADGDADALVDMILQRRPKGRLLHVRGAHSRGAVADRLRASGLDAQEVIAYDQPLLPLTDDARAALDGAAPVVVPLFSPRTAQHLSAQNLGKAPIYVAAISQTVADAVPAAYVTMLETAAAPNANAMREAVRKLLSAAAKLEDRGGAQ